MLSNPYLSLAYAGEMWLSAAARRSMNVTHFAAQLSGARCRLQCKKMKQLDKFDFQQAGLFDGSDADRDAIL